MCGRYVSPNEAALNREYLVDARNSGQRLQRLFEDGRSYNVAPTQGVPVVRVIRKNTGRDSGGARECVEMRWGLVPFWSKGIPPKFSSINATIEKLENGPTWRGPWKRGQRCIVPAVGFYEWHVNPDGSKTPYFIEPADKNSTFAFAGLWDESKADNVDAIVSCTIITMPPNELMAEIHNAKKRMPAILDKDDLETWLTGTPEQAKTVLKQYPQEMMHAYIVSSRVNSPRNNDPKLIQPLDAVA